MAQYITHYFISPNFTHQKLEPPFFRDVVDVFDDRMRNWLIVPAKELLRSRHGQMAAVSLTISYFEAIEMYLSGEDSKRHSRKFFIRGFNRVFEKISGPEAIRESIASSLYKLMRCGFAHEGIPGAKILFSTMRPQAFTITWPRVDGEFDPHGSLESAIVNPDRFIAGIEAHFDSYVRELKRPASSEVKERFWAMVTLKWRLDSIAPLVAMTEEEFYRKSFSQP